MLPEETPQTAKPTLPRRRWFQFGLRSLLLFTTVTGCILGWIAKERLQTAVELQVAEELKNFRWSVVAKESEYENGSEKSDDLRRYLMRKILGERISVAASNFDVETKSIGLLAELKSLRVLSLVCTNITDFGHLAGLDNLEELYLCDMSASDLSSLKGLKKLRKLDLEGQSIKSFTPLGELSTLQDLRIDLDALNDDVLALCKLKSLEVLHLDDTPVRDEQVQAIQESLPCCRIVRQ